MPVELTFAHLSDPHLPLPPGWPPWRLLLNKRALGYLAWRRHRQAEHRPEALTALVDDVARHAPDHVLVTGDLVNIALSAEFEAARDWLGGVGPPEGVTVVPGNHDCYVAMAAAEGLARWQPWMSGDGESATAFPFLRRRGPVAFVCLSTALPTLPFLASGALGAEQLGRLEALLGRLGRERLFRVLVLHHPPEDRPTGRRKGLTDRAGLQRVLLRTGAELVVHGHQHRSRFGLLAGPGGPIPVLGVPSASMRRAARKGEPARWHLLRIRHEGDGWRLAVIARGLAREGFRTLGRWHLSSSS